MVLPHIYFLLFNFLIFGLVLYADRKHINDYVWLSVFGLIAAYIFETATTYLGFWYYHSEPLIPLISLYTWLLYMPYLSFCYFIGRKWGGSSD